MLSYDVLATALWRRCECRRPHDHHRTRRPPRSSVSCRRGFGLLDAAADLPSSRSAPRARVSSRLPFYGKGVARLKTGVSIEQANADLGRLLPRWLDRFPFPNGGDAKANYLGSWKITPALRPLKQDVVGDIGNSALGGHGHDRRRAP